DLRQQVVDSLVALGRDTQPLPLRQQVDGEASSGPRLSRARRSLDEEVAGLEVERQCLHLLEVESLKSTASRAPPNARLFATENGPQRRVAAVAHTDRLGHSQDRVALIAILVGAFRDERPRKRNTG